MGNVVNCSAHVPTQNRKHNSMHAISEYQKSIFGNYEINIKLNNVEILQRKKSIKLDPIKSMMYSTMVALLSTVYSS